jgi:hypothetical protein
MAIAFYDGFRQNRACFWRNSRIFGLNPFKSGAISQKLLEKTSKRPKKPRSGDAGVFARPIG